MTVVDDTEVTGDQWRVQTTADFAGGNNDINDAGSPGSYGFSPAKQVGTTVPSVPFPETASKSGIYRLQVQIHSVAVEEFDPALLDREEQGAMPPPGPTADLNCPGTATIATPDILGNETPIFGAAEDFTVRFTYQYVAA